MNLAIVKDETGKPTEVHLISCFKLYGLQSGYSFSCLSLSREDTEKVIIDCEECKKKLEEK